MKTILWATLSANGNYARRSPRHPPKQEALADFAAETGAYGNFIVGRKTFEELQANAERRPSAPMPQTDIVESKAHRANRARQGAGEASLLARAVGHVVIRV
jgi:hypothetical protein